MGTVPSRREELVEKQGTPDSMKGKEIEVVFTVP